jgi:hypothetical protein
MSFGPWAYRRFANCCEATFEARLARFLREQFPEEGGADDAQFRNEIRAQIGAARSYGFETEQQFATYLVAACALGVDFDRRFPATEQVLASTFLTGDEKARWLDSWTRALFESLEGQD